MQLLFRHTLVLSVFQLSVTTQTQVEYIFQKDNLIHDEDKISYTIYMVRETPEHCKISLISGIDYTLFKE